MKSNQNKKLPGHQKWKNSHEKALKITDHIEFRLGCLCEIEEVKSCS